jgi:hypothetical protein
LSLGASELVMSQDLNQFSFVWASTNEKKTLETIFLTKDESRVSFQILLGSFSSLEIDIS